MKPRFKETERMVANHALEQVAKQNGVTLEEVEMEIQQVSTVRFRFIRKRAILLFILFHPKTPCHHRRKSSCGIFR